jgi:predicted GTPase
MLTPDDSIKLLTQCVQYGKRETKKAEGKNMIIFIGNTGAGKSTTVNYLYGCTMITKSPAELGLKGLEDIVVVQPVSSGGKRNEVMAIGHTKRSTTFIPSIETDEDNDLTYCDCPGFLDNRGNYITNIIAEINTILSC